MRKPETHSVDFVPIDERYGKASSQFPLWFSVNMMLLTTLTGGIGVSLGLSLGWAAVAIVAGNFIGAVFVAGHAVQGPHLGIPQMIQSRAQFGYFGATIPLVAVLMMYLGYFASNQVIAGDALAAGTPIGKSAGIIITGLLIFGITFYGYDVIHKVEKLFAFLLGCGFIAVTFATVTTGNTVEFFSFDSFNLALFLVQMSATAAWQLTFAPYIADYSRYLPVETSGVKLVFYTYMGLVVSTTWLMTLGALLAVKFPSYGEGPSEVIAGLFPSSLSPLVFSFIVLGVIATNVFNLYGAFMALTTIIDTFKRVPPSTVIRFCLILLVFASGILIAIASSSNFLTFFENLLVILGYLLFPWTSINLVDFFFIRKGNYSIKDIFKEDGIYGRFNWRAIAAYMITVLIELPFMSTAFFEGPLFQTVGSVDIAWIIALVLPGILYFVFMASERRKDVGLAVNK